MRLPQAFTDQRGVALPMALLTLLLLTTLMMAFAVLAQTEPIIAANQLRTAQARSLAESGVEQAIWALTNGNNGSGAANAIPNPMVLTPPGAANSPALAPWDGNTFISAGSAGGFLVAVRNDQSGAGDPHVREITAIGWTPTNNPAVSTTKAHRQVFVRVQVLPSNWTQAPCALCANGNLSIGGHSTVDGTNTDPSCGANNKYGAYTAGATTVSGSASVTGGGGSIAQNVGSTPFASFTYSSTALDQLKALAKMNGTYFGPGYPNGGFTNNGSTTWSGSLYFNSANKVGNGIVFVDTTNGVDLPPGGTNTSTMANVTINGNPFTGVPPTGTSLPNVPTSSTNGAFSGVIVVNGSLAISGNMVIDGFIYAANNFVYNGTGTGGIYGQVISQNVRDVVASAVDDTSTGNSKVIFNCAYAKGFNMIPPGFNMIAGSYRELHD